MSDVVVIGGGISGITAALDLANHGIKVHLIEREPTIGGHMAMLDKTFPTNDCSMCILSPKMVDVDRHENVTNYTCTEVVSVEGDAGNFRVRVVSHPRYIDAERCNGCGDCTQVCPVEVYNRFDAGLGVRKAIYKPHSQAVPNIVVRDAEHCIECGLCYDVCGRNAVLRNDEDCEKEFEILADAVVVTTGYEVFDAQKKSAYRYLIIPDVITSLEFERMICASGPTGGKLKRLSNGKTPEQIVFVQCVGSRECTQEGNPYCSCVCCMYAIKNAMLIKEKHPEIDVTVLYMDIRAYGKGYEEYYNRAVELGINFVRGLPGEVLDNGDKLLLPVENTETRELPELNADLVVLSVGMTPAVDTEKIAEKLGIKPDENGFMESKSEKLDAVSTIKPGIFIAGTCRAPQDIPDCVTEGGAAAMRAVIDAECLGLEQH